MKRVFGALVVMWGLGGAACHRVTTPPSQTVEVPSGPFWMGSTADQRGQAVEVAHAAHQGVVPETVKWLREELPARRVKQAAFHIMARPVTQAEYFAYVVEVDAPEPWIDRAAWEQQHTGYDYDVVKRFGWKKGRPQPDREIHPAVLVSQTDAAAYCQWWGERHRGRGRLPTEAQWEKAARGPDGRAYPWGDRFTAGWINSLEGALADTIEVGLSPEMASPYGVQDMAGNVFEWTRSPDGVGRFVVKGGAWNSDGATARAAARHYRPARDRHVVIGFRCVFAP